MNMNGLICLIRSRDKGRDELNKSRHNSKKTNENSCRLLLWKYFNCYLSYLNLAKCEHWMLEWFGQSQVFLESHRLVMVKTASCVIEVWWKDLFFKNFVHYIIQGTRTHVIATKMMKTMSPTIDKLQIEKTVDQ